MSPKSRGRPQGRGKQKKRGGGSLSAADRVLKEAVDLEEERVRLIAEEVASGWLGSHWLSREGATEPEDELIRDVILRAKAKRSEESIVALHALRLVAPPRTHPALDELIAELTPSLGAPPFTVVPPGQPMAAWSAEDPWGSRQILFIEFGAPTPHTLLADVAHGAGTNIEELALVEPGLDKRWPDMTAEEEFPLVLAPLAVEEALTQLAALLELTDAVEGRAEELGEYAPLRSLALSRCTGVEPDLPEPQDFTDDELDALISEFHATTGTDPEGDLVRPVVEMLVDFGEEQLRGGLLAWTPEDVAFFLLEWVPETVDLDEAAVAVVLDLTRDWVQFTLTKKGLEQRWIDVLKEVIDEVEPEFRGVATGKG